MARKPQGRFWGMPYNWRATRKDARTGIWDRDDRRVITPKNYGWGYSINFAALWQRLRRR